MRLRKRRPAPASRNCSNWRGGRTRSWRRCASRPRPRGERVQPAGALPDPMGRLELRDVGNQMGNGDFNLLPARVGSAKYTVVQPLPFWGKRDLKREVAEADAAQAQARRSGTWAELAAKVKAAFAQYYYVGHSLKLAQELLRLGGSLEQLTQARYSDGLVPQQDVMRAQVEKTTLRSELLMLETEHHHAAARLNALLRRPPAAPLAEPQALRPLPPPAKLDFVALEARLLAANPQLAAQDAQISRGREEPRAGDEEPLSRLHRRRLADPDAQPRQRMGADVRSEHPAAAGSRAARRSARRRRWLARARSRKERRAQPGAPPIWRRTSRRWMRRGALEQLVATACCRRPSSTFKAALAGYETGKVDFATLLDAQRQIRKAKQDLLKAQVEAQVRLADIERLLGEDL